MSAAYIFPVRIFVGRLESSKVLGHRNVEMVLRCIGIGREVSNIERVGIKRVSGRRVVAAKILVCVHILVSSKFDIPSPLCSSLIGSPDLSRKMF